jgi:hypothetical protein
MVFNCDICDKSYSTKGSLKAHIIRIHDKVRHNCPSCNYTDSTKGNIKQHIKTVHDKIKDCCCELCDFKSSSKGDIKRHVKIVHDKIKDFCCGLCNYTCSGNNTLNRHLKTCTGEFQGSSAEYTIKKLLEELKIEHIYDQSFWGVRDKSLLRFDFILNPYSEFPAVIEFDGEFHYNAIRMGHQTQTQANTALENAKRRDEIKNKYCDENDIFMIRIPYWKQKDLKEIVSEFVRHVSI